MKTTDAQKIDEAKAAFLAAHTKQQTKAAFLCLLTLFVVIVLPELVPSPFSVIVMVGGSATLFTAFFLLYPQSLRTRNGSWTPAYCLLAFQWLCAVAVTLLSLTGRIE
jgi:hypothetical protein